MARIARVVVPDAPHHVTQRGGRRQLVFLREADYGRYLGILEEQTRQHGVRIWAYCLMPNHVHLIAVPADAGGLARTLGEAHRRYAAHVNGREGWRGHLWQERFWSTALDDRHLAAAIRYVLFNPVRAGLVDQPELWPYSSAAALWNRAADPLIGTDSPARDWLLGAAARMVRPDWESSIEELRRHTASGRPLGDPAFADEIERRIGRRVQPLSPGRPRKSASAAASIPEASSGGSMANP